MDLRKYIIVENTLQTTDFIIKKSKGKRSLLISETDLEEVRFNLGVDSAEEAKAEIIDKYIEDEDPIDDVASYDTEIEEPGEEESFVDIDTDMEEMVDDFINRILLLFNHAVAENHAGLSKIEESVYNTEYIINEDVPVLDDDFALKCMYKIFHKIKYIIMNKLGEDINCENITSKLDQISTQCRKRIAIKLFYLIEKLRGLKDGTNIDIDMKTETRVDEFINKVLLLFKGDVSIREDAPPVDEGQMNSHTLLDFLGYIKNATIEILGDGNYVDDSDIRFDIDKVSDTCKRRIICKLRKLFDRLMYIKRGGDELEVEKIPEEPPIADDVEHYDKKSNISDDSLLDIF